MMKKIVDYTLSTLIVVLVGLVIYMLVAKPTVKVDDMMSDQAVISAINKHVFVYTGPYSELPQGVDLEICEIRNDTIWLCPNSEQAGY